MPRRPASSTLPRAIDPQHRVRLPNEVMDSLGVKTGDSIGFEILDGEARIFRVTWVRDRERSARSK